MHCLEVFLSKQTKVGIDQTTEMLSSAVMIPVDGIWVDVIGISRKQLVKQGALMKEIDIVKCTWVSKECIPDAKVLACNGL